MHYHANDLFSTTNALPTVGTSHPSTLLRLSSGAGSTASLLIGGRALAAGLVLLTYSVCPGGRAPAAGLGSGPAGGRGRGGGEAGRAAHQCPAAAGGKDDGQAGIPAQGREPAGDGPLLPGPSAWPLLSRPVHMLCPALLPSSWEPFLLSSCIFPFLYSSSP